MLFDECVYCLLNFWYFCRKFIIFDETFKVETLIDIFGDEFEYFFCDFLRVDNFGKVIDDVSVLICVIVNVIDYFVVLF